MKIQTPPTAPFSRVSYVSDHKKIDLPVPLPSADVLGIRFHCLTMAEVIRVLSSYIQQKKTRQICLANAYTVSLSWKNPALRELLNRADLVLPDGMSIVWGSAWLGSYFPERVPGPDLMEALCAESAAKGYKIYFMGNTPETLALLEKVLLGRWPNLNIVGRYSPPICDRLEAAENQRIFEDIRAAQPDILLVSMSCPKQEIWISENLQHLNVPVCIGAGAAFDFLSGRIPRAPEWLQKTGLEWLHRLSCEPRRLWKRYLLGNYFFLSHLAAAWVRLRIRSMK